MKHDSLDPQESNETAVDDRALSVCLKSLVTIALFMAIFTFFCGPVVIGGRDGFRFPGYIKFVAIALLLWGVRLFYLAVHGRSIACRYTSEAVLSLANHQGTPKRWY